MNRKFLRSAALAGALLVAGAAPAFAQLTLSYNVPGVRIGVNLGGYPALQPVPGYPVYYAPGVNANYFFYDGMYWVFDGANWYASSWYNGPWAVVDPFDVPLYVLRVPVRYYRHAPAYFHSWRADAPPRWGERWGRGWEDRNRGWDHWDRRSAPRAAPLPTYQREYRGDRYPDYERQNQLHGELYRYEPRDDATRRHYEQRRGEVQQEQRSERRGPGNSDFGHQQGQGRGREYAPGQQGRQGETRSQQPERSEPRPGWYSGG